MSMKEYDLGLHSELRDQLRAHVVSDVLGPIEKLTVEEGPAQGLLATLTAQLWIDAEMWAAQIAGRDRALAARTVRTVLSAFFDGPASFDPEPAWWRTPLGRATLATVGHPYASTVSVRAAGDMLGMSRQGAHDLVRRGRLGRTEEGRVTVSSIVGYLEPTPDRQVGPRHDAGAYPERQLS